MQQCKFLLFSCCCLLYCSIKEAIKRSVFHFSHEATFSFVGGITYYVSKTWQNQSSKTRSAFQGRKFLPTLLSFQLKCSSNIDSIHYLRLTNSFDQVPRDIHTLPSIIVNFLLNSLNAPITFVVCATNQS